MTIQSNNVRGRLTGKRLAIVLVIILGILLLAFQLLYQQIDALIILIEDQNDIQEQQTMALQLQTLNSILSGLSSKDPSTYAVASTMLCNFHMDDYEFFENLLLDLSSSEDQKHYQIKKAALRALISTGTVSSKKLVELFWHICILASERDYFNDPDLLQLYQEIEIFAELSLASYLRDVLYNDINEDAETDMVEDSAIADINEDAIATIKKKYNLNGEVIPLFEAIEIANELLDLSDQYRDHASFTIEQAKMYVNSYKLFKVLTYLAIHLYTEVAPSGVYQQFKPGTLNIHRDIFRFRNTYIPDFFSGGKQFAINYASSDAGYERVWQDLFVNDPLLRESNYSASSILFVTNSKGLFFKKEVVIICPDEESEWTLHKMIYSLLKKYSGLRVRLRSVQEVYDDLEGYTWGIAECEENKKKLLSTILHVTLDKKTLDELAAKMEEESIDEWNSVTQYITLVSFLPLADKDHDFKELQLQPRNNFYYNPKNPFGDVDVQKIIVDEFQKIIRGDN